MDTIERKPSEAAQERLYQREAEKAQTKSELERLQLQLATAQTEITPEAMVIIIAAWRAQFERIQASGNVRELKAWLMQFVYRIELGYNRARIFYTYPMVDLFTAGESHGSSSLSVGALFRTAAKRSILVEWSK